MTGLEKIVQKIISDAESKAQLILDRANEYVKEQEAETERQRETLIAEAVAQGKREAQVLEVRMNSLAEATSRKSDLEQRRQTVSKTIDLALQQLSGRSDEEKVQLYSELIGKSKLQGGSVSLATSEQHLVKQLLAAVGDNFTVGEPADISGGVILRSGDITENLSYDLVIRNYLPELSAVAASHLFTQEQ